MLHFEAEDGYSYLVKVFQWKGPERVYRVDSGKTSINLLTNEKIEICRLDIKPEVSIQLGELQKNLPR